MNIDDSLDQGRELGPFSYKEVYDKTIKYFRGDDLATNVWISKYCKKSTDENGNEVYYESTPDDMFRRIASEIVRVSQKNDAIPLKYEDVYCAIKDFKYVLFQGRPMAGIGIDEAVSISNCFVVGKPGQDSYGTIAMIDQHIMQLSKRGGGVGTDLSDYRANGARVHNAALSSSGPVDICATRFSNTIREVGQNGRRGALMLSMDINSQSAEEFIDAKVQDGKISGANISVKIDDEWLKEATGEDKQCEEGNMQPLIGNIIDAEKNRLWKKIIHNATTKAEPGILFWDTIKNESVSDCYSKFGFNTTSTNPCLVGDTMIMTDCGPVRIDDIVKKYNNGEFVSVISYNVESGSIECKKIDGAFKTKENAEIIEVETDNGKILRLTPDHKVFTENRGYVMASELTNDDILLFAEDE